MAVSRVVNLGIGLLNNRLKSGDALSGEPNMVMWGTGTTPVDVTDIGLETPATEPMIAGTSSLTTTNTLNDTYEVIATMVCNPISKAITEVGLFDMGGNIFSRGTFDPINVSEGDSIQFTIKTVTDQA